MPEFSKIGQSNVEWNLSTATFSIEHPYITSVTLAGTYQSGRTLRLPRVQST